MSRIDFLLSTWAPAFYMFIRPIQAILRLISKFPLALTSPLPPFPRKKETKRNFPKGSSKDPHWFIGREKERNGFAISSEKEFSDFCPGLSENEFHGPLCRGYNFLCELLVFAKVLSLLYKVISVHVTDRPWTNGEPVLFFLALTPFLPSVIFVLPKIGGQGS